MGVVAPVFPDQTVSAPALVLILVVPRATLGLASPRAEEVSCPVVDPSRFLGLGPVLVLSCPSPVSEGLDPEDHPDQTKLVVGNLGLEGSFRRRCCRC